MSHLVDVDIEIRDLDSLEAACAAIGLELRRGQETHRWYGQFMNDSTPPEWVMQRGIEKMGTCDHAIAVAGNASAYEIGVVDMGDGTYRLVWDNWCGGQGLEAAAGKGLDNLVGEYALTVAQAQCNQLGWINERQKDCVIAHHPSGGQLRIDRAGAVDATGFIGGECKEAVQAVAGAIGSEADVHVKPEFYTTQQKLRRTES